MSGLTRQEGGGAIDKKSNETRMAEVMEALKL